MNHIKLDREKKIPHVKTKLRSHHIVTMPDEIYAASGIVIMGRRIKSLIFSTDIAIIRNCNADAVLAVYPFTPQAGITQAIIGVSDVPVFVGVICDPGFYAVHYGVFVFHYDTAFLAARFSADRWSQ